MAQKKRSGSAKGKTNNSRAARQRDAVAEEMAIRNKEIIGIAVIAAAILLLLAVISAPKDTTAEVSAFGYVSLWLTNALRFLMGGGAVIMPVFLLVFGVLVCAGKNRENSGSRLLGLTLVFVCVLGFLQISAELLPFKEYIDQACTGTGGGLFGALLDFCLLKTIGKIGALILLIAVTLIGLLLTFQTTLRKIGRGVGSGCKKLQSTVNYAAETDTDPVDAVEDKSFLRRRFHKAVAPVVTEAAPEEKEQKAESQIEASAEEVNKETEPMILWSKETVAAAETEADPTPALTEESLPLPEKKVAVSPLAPPPPENRFSRQFMPRISDDRTAAVAASPAVIPPVPVVKPQPVPEEKPIPPQPKPKKQPEPKPEPVPQHIAEIESIDDGSYRLPPVELIDGGQNKKSAGMNQAITDNIAVLENTLHSFGVKASVTQVVAGPAVTRYELQPAPGVKVARITSLADDIALSLAAPSVRIEAPIPGKSAIGIEVARKERDTVFFREMIDSENFQKAESKLTVVLGKNIGGECVVADLTKMPHLLIAGTTGSGKSVCINALICSILYKAKPDEVKMMLIDPKKVEMTTYTNLPHLIAPVISDCKKASNALKWIVNEMENRYTVFAANGVKDIKGYAELFPDAPMCKIVVIIDELADLMLVAKHDVEDSICRIAQLARAAGIHLVVATQRPSVDVITGLIKANIPSRIAFTVSSPVDSRTILDCGGAEKLLGNGDMLYDPIGNNKPMRIQGSFINEKDVAKLVNYCARQASPSFSKDAMESVDNGGKSIGGQDEDLDELFYEAGMIIINTGQASTSFLQRRLAIGNPRAARLMDMLESKGVVGGPNGSKPREILFTAEEFEELYG